MAARPISNPDPTDPNQCLTSLYPSAIEAVFYPANTSASNRHEAERMQRGFSGAYGLTPATGALPLMVYDVESGEPFSPAPLA